MFIRLRIGMRGSEDKNWRRGNMFEFTLEWTNSQSRTERAASAKVATDHTGVRAALILPLVLLIAFLFAHGIMTGAHLHQRADRALLHAAFRGMGMPMRFHSLRPH
jgi:hypothetical protein